MIPLPPLEVTTGIFVASASLTRASSASDRATPPPANIRGYGGLGDNRGSLPEVLGAGHNPGDTGRIPQLDFLSLDAGLRGHLDQNGSGATGAHLSEGFKHGVRDLPRSGHLALPLGHRTHYVGLVGDFMNGAEVLADCGARDLAGDEEHGRGA